MTIEQKENIKKLRLRDLSYGQIAKLLGLSINTIKSFCQRNNVPTRPPSQIKATYSQDFCPSCFSELIHIAGRKKKKFCSDKCRTIWWANNPDKLDKKAIYNIICASCGTEFEAYGNKDRKFCSHNCYIASRFGKEVENEA